MPRIDEVDTLKNILNIFGIRKPTKIEMKTEEEMISIFLEDMNQTLQIKQYNKPKEMTPMQKLEEY